MNNCEQIRLTTGHNRVRIDKHASLRSGRRCAFRVVVHGTCVAAPRVIKNEPPTPEGAPLTFFLINGYKEYNRRARGGTIMMHDTKLHKCLCVSSARTLIAPPRSRHDNAARTTSPHNDARCVARWEVPPNAQNTAMCRAPGAASIRETN